MPGKTFDPKAPIDASLFGHIQNDAFLSGTFELESNNFIRTVGYLRRYFADLSTTGKLPQASQDMRVRMQGLLEFEERLSALRSKSRYEAEKTLKFLSENIASTVHSLNVDNYLSLPGGWSGVGDPGHAMMYQFKRTSEGLEFYIHNAGAGVSYHERRSTTQRELYYPVKAYKIPLPCDPNKLAAFIRDLMVPQVPVLREGTKTELFDEKQLYEKVLPRIHFLDAELISIKNKKIHAYTAGQLSGTCSERCIHQMWKANAKSEQEYQRDIYNFKRYALDDYMRVIEKTGEMANKGVRSQVKHAISTLLKTLNIKGLFTDNEVSSQRKALQDYQQLLKSTAHNKPAINGDEQLFSNTPTDTISTTFDVKLPQVARIYVNPSKQKSAVNTPPPTIVKGGQDLLAEMDAIQKACEAFKANGQYHAIFEYLESVFVSLPIISESWDKPSFYNGIYNAEKATEFCTRIESLQTLYLESCKSLFSDAALPRKLVVNLSAIALLDSVRSLFPLSADRSLLHQTVGHMLLKFLQGNDFNPYFATNDPVLDERLQKIKTFYFYTAETNSYLSYMQSILDTDRKLTQELLKRYQQNLPQPEAFSNSLKTFGLELLYYFTTNFEALKKEPQYERLTQKFEQQRQIEHCFYQSLKGFCQIEPNNPGVHFGPGTSGEVVYWGTEVTIGRAKPDARFLKVKYGPAENDFSQQALQLDYNYDASVSYEHRHDKKARDNLIQLFPGDAIRLPKEKLDDKTKEALASRQIDKRAIEERELFHLRNSPHNQIKLTLDYFQRNLSKLSEKKYQCYVEANLFEPGLLLDELNKNPKGFLIQLVRFIEKGINHFSVRGLATQPTLFFIRLAYLVNQYIAKKEGKFESDFLKNFQKQLTQLLLVNEDNDVAIKQSLHQYQFLTAMARFKHEVLSDQEQQDLLAIALPSYFYLNSKSNPKMLPDAATRFELECAKQDFQRLLAAVTENAPPLISQLVGESIEQLGLGNCDRNPTEAGSLYKVVTQQGGQYTVDVSLGLVFNKTGMALSAVPLNILHHPVLKFLGISNLESGYKSSDGLVFEIEKPALRFIWDPTVSKYIVQKKWTVSQKTQWYELHSLSSKQGSMLGLANQTIPLAIPTILQQRENLIWVNCDVTNSMLLTEKNCPRYQFEPFSLYKMIGYQLNDNGQRNGAVLCTNKTWIHTLFSNIENEEFITVCKDQDKYQIIFGRYGLTLLASKENGVYVFCLENNRSLKLMMEATPLAPGVVGLVFEDEKTKKREFYLPVQPFIKVQDASPRSEFHRFRQDISGAVPEYIIEEAVKGVQELLPPWQRAESERLLHYKLDDKGEPIAETSGDALYLCYVYLGSQHPEKAWAVLDDCAKRLGGLHGTAEELSYLNMIINGLPRIIGHGATDNKVTISTPAYVACKLKALALFTNTFTPDQVITWPSKSVDIRTPDSIYQDFSLTDSQKFYDQLNNTIFRLYSRFQNMQRHIEQPFQLNDFERKSLLDYYHFHLPGNEPKALGSLGYEWQRLGLKSLRKEYEALSAEKVSRGTLPAAYQKRLDEIEEVLRKGDLVRANHSELELLSIDLKIPPEVTFDESKIDDKSVLQQARVKWYNNVTVAVDDDSRSKAMRILTPEISATQFFEHFPVYFAILTDEPRDSENRKACFLFCRQYLIANSHISLTKQEDNTAYLCNILYRIAVDSEFFISQLANSWKLDFLAVLEQAQKLPDPDIKIYQVKQTTRKILASAKEVWDSLENEVPASGALMVAANCNAIDNFSVDKLLVGLPKIEQIKRFCQAYKEEAIAFNVPDAQSTDVEVGERKCQALVAMNDIATQLLSDPTLQAGLRAKVNAFIKSLEDLKKNELNNALTLAQEGPSDPEEKQRYELEIASGARAPLTTEQLLALYFKADKANYKIATGLTDEKIAALHTALSHYLAFSIRQQGLERLNKRLNEAEKTPDAPTFQKAAHELLTDNLVSAEKDPVMTIIQYQENILLRPQQRDAIQRLLASPQQDPHAYSEVIEKIIMGGGKSKVILPVIAKSKAVGTNLVVVEVPRALFETNCADLAHTSEHLFGQKAVPFQFNRDSDCSPEGLEFLYSKLTGVISNKDYLVTTGDAVQSLELKYLELLLQRPRDEASQQIWAKQIEWLNKLVLLFRTRADAVIDEVHQGLLLKRKLNYAVGMKRRVPPHLLSECVEIYSFFDQIWLDEVLGKDFAGKSLTDLMKNNQLVTDDTSWNNIMAHLARQLVEQAGSPLQRWMNKGGFTETDKADLLNYFANKGSTEPPCVRRADAKMKSIFALYKEQVGQLEQEGQLLPRTLRRKLNEHYGASHKRDLDPMTRALAIPYLANNAPSERSRFGNFLESINFSVQLLLSEGFGQDLLKSFLGHLQEQARQELREKIDLKTVDNTPTAKGFSGWMPPEFKLSLSQIHLDDDEQFDDIFKQLCKNKNLICVALQDFVLPQIEVDAEILHSDAYNHVDIYRSCQGVTGTPSNSSTYHQRLSYDNKTAAGTDELILAVLKAKNTLVHAVDFSTTTAFIERLFANRQANETMRAIVDVAATFKGVSNLEVATALAKYIKNNPQQFSDPSKLKYILFFNEDNVLCAFDILKERTPIVLGSTDPDEINTKLACTPDERFSYYDQIHVEGVDLKQTKRAKAFVLIDPETEKTKFLQGATRLRELVQGEQQTEIIVPTKLHNQSLDSLFTMMEANEQRQIRKDGLPAGQAKMTNLIRADFMKRLLATDLDVEKKHQFAEAFKSYFVGLETADFFARYGGLVSMRDVVDILEEQRERLIKDWSDILKGLGEIIIPADEDSLRTELNSIIESTLAICDQKSLSPTRQDQGNEVEVQKQVELQKEMHRELKRFNPSLKEHPYRSWTLDDMCCDFTKIEGCKLLTTLCHQDAPNAPDFGNTIHVTENYYATYVGQPHFLDPFLKPVHALLFRLREDGRLDCLIVSQKEADEIEENWDNSLSNIWLSTTQHTLLVGSPPFDIESNKDYQVIIEKIRFFNGEFDLLLDSDVPVNWLTEETTQKLTFFEQNLLPYRDTQAQHVARLRQSLSHKKQAFRYIADHPLENYRGFDWRGNIDPELNDTDIEEIEALAGVFEKANSLFPKYSLEKDQINVRLSIQATGVIKDYLDKLVHLQLALQSIERGILSQVDIDSLDPLFITGYIPPSATKQTLLQKVLEEASGVADPTKWLNLAEGLIKKGAEVYAVNEQGHSLTDFIIINGGEHMAAVLTWLMAKGVELNINEKMFSSIRTEVVEQLFALPAFEKNESLLLFTVNRFRSGDELLKIMKCLPSSKKLLSQIITTICEWNKPIEPIVSELFATNDLFKTDIELVTQLLDKSFGTTVLYILSKQDWIDEKVLGLLITRSCNDMILLTQIFAFQQNKFTQAHLQTFLAILQHKISSTDSSRVLDLFNKVLNHKQAEAIPDIKQVKEGLFRDALRIASSKVPNAPWLGFAEQLIQGGVDLQTVDDNGYSVFDIVVNGGGYAEKVIKWLIDHHAEVNFHQDTYSKSSFASNPTRYSLLMNLLTWPEFKSNEAFLNAMVRVVQWDDRPERGLYSIMECKPKDPDTWKKIISGVKVQHMTFIRTVLENHSFETDPQLLDFWITSLTEERQIFIIKQLVTKSEISPDVLTVMINRSNTIDVLDQIFNAHNSVLDIEQLSAMVNKLMAQKETLGVTSLLSLLQKILNHSLAVSIPNVLLIKQQLFEFVLKKACSVPDPIVLLTFAEWLYKGGVDLNQVDGFGDNALDLIVMNGGLSVEKVGEWLLSRAPQLSLHPETYRRAAPSTLENLFFADVAYKEMRRCFYNNESLLLTLVEPHKQDNLWLSSIFCRAPESSEILKQILAKMVNPTDSLLSQLLDNSQFNTNEEFLKQLLERASVTQRPTLLAKLAARPGLSSEVLSFIIQESTAVDVLTQVLNHQHKELRTPQLTTILKTLLAQKEEARVLTVLQQTLEHPLSKYITDIKEITKSLLFLTISKAAINGKFSTWYQFATRLAGKEVELDALDTNGYSAWDHVIQSNGLYIEEIVKDLQQLGVTMLVHEDTLRRATTSTMDQLVKSGILNTYEPFLFELIRRYRTDGAKLLAILDCRPDSLTVLEKIIEVIEQPTASFLQGLLANEYFKTNIVLVEQLLQKVPQGDCPLVLSSILSGEGSPSQDVLMVIVRHPAFGMEHADQLLPKCNDDHLSVVFELLNNAIVKDKATEYLIALREKATELPKPSSTLPQEGQVVLEQFRKMIATANARLLHNLKPVRREQLDYIKDVYLLCVKAEKAYKACCAYPMDQNNLTILGDLAKQISETSSHLAMQEKKPSKGKSKEPDKELHFWQRWISAFKRLIKAIVNWFKSCLCCAKPEPEEPKGKRPGFFHEKEPGDKDDELDAKKAPTKPGRASRR